MLATETVASQRRLVIAVRERERMTDSPAQAQMLTTNTKKRVAVARVTGAKKEKSMMVKEVKPEPRLRMTNQKSKAHHQCLLMITSRSKASKWYILVHLFILIETKKIFFEYFLI
jgi:hypothetical protein